MNRRALLPAAGLALIVLTNAVVLGGAAWNRAGAPDSELQLSQRELQVDRGFGRENSGVALELLYRVEYRDADNDRTAVCYSSCAPRWLDAAKLSDLGFALDAGDDEQAREAVVVLELEGPAYQGALERARRAAQRPPGEDGVGLSPAERLKLEEEQYSRLFVVDAGLDAEALRARYADRSRYLLARGLIKAALTGQDKAAPVGWIERLSNGRVHVPARFRRALLDAPEAPRYAVTLRSGKRLEPWIADVVMVK